MTDDYDDGDVAYGVWQRGGNPDRVNPDRVDGYRDRGLSEHQAVEVELQHQRPSPKWWDRAEDVAEAEPEA